MKRPEWIKELMQKGMTKLVFINALGEKDPDFTYGEIDDAFHDSFKLMVTYGQIIEGVSAPICPQICYRRYTMFFWGDD